MQDLMSLNEEVHVMEITSTFSMTCGNLCPFNALPNVQQAFVSCEITCGIHAYILGLDMLACATCHKVCAFPYSSCFTRVAHHVVRVCHSMSHPRLSS